MSGLEMSLQLSSVQDKGNLDKERIVLTADADCDIGFYAFFRCTANDKGRPLSGAVPNVYWFMNKDVKKGDLIVLYSKRGTRSEKEIGEGHKSHFFYWGMTTSLWTKGVIPVLVKTSEWHNSDPIL
jgi:hypothetical protein